jgi:hypothetical protein
MMELRGNEAVSAIISRCGIGNRKGLTDALI